MRGGNGKARRGAKNAQDLFGLKDSEVKALGVRNVDDRNKILSSLRNLQERRKKDETRLRKCTSSSSINSVRSLVNIPPAPVEGTVEKIPACRAGASVEKRKARKFRAMFGGSVRRASDRRRPNLAPAPSRKNSCVSDLSSLRRRPAVGGVVSAATAASEVVPDRKISVVEWLECEALLKSCADYEELQPLGTSSRSRRILQQNAHRKNEEDDVMDPQHIKKMLEWELSLDSNDLRSHAWYHGSIPRAHADRILLHDREFLVRDCGSHPGSFVLSCRHGKTCLHFVINRVLVQQGTIYERIQFQFEEESFDSVAGLITYYVGSGKPISSSSGARICHPRNRLYPLTYFPNQLTNPESSSTVGSPRSLFATSSSPLLYDTGTLSRPGSTSTVPGNRTAVLLGSWRTSTLSTPRLTSPVRDTSMGQCVSSEATLAMSSGETMSNGGVPGNDRRPHLSGSKSLPRIVKARNAGFKHDGKVSPVKSHQDILGEPAQIIEAGGEKVALRKQPTSRASSRPPPVVVYGHGNGSEPEFLTNSVSYLPGGAGNTGMSRSGSPSSSACSKRDSHDAPDYDTPPPPVLTTAVNKTRWTHRSSGSDSGMNSAESMTSGESESHAKDSIARGDSSILSAFDVEHFQSLHVPSGGKMKLLDAEAYVSIKKTLFDRPAKVFASRITAIDIDLLKIVNDSDLGLGITSGIELITIPEGKQMRNDVIERVNCLSCFVAATIVQGDDDKERSELIHTWIQIADELRTAQGNLLGFAAVMLGIDSSPVQRLSSTWYKVRQTHTDSAHKFEARLRAIFKSMNDSRAPPSTPNTSVPYVLPLCYLLETCSEQDVSDSDSSSSFYSGSCAREKSLALLVAQVEEGMRLCQSASLFNACASRLLINGGLIGDDPMANDVLRTEFHLQYLFGVDGATAERGERFTKLRKLLDMLSRQCERGDHDYT